ncbi:TVP38/TMEM64 family protein [Solirubrobacter soli]|uniref:TVP38/TMEM64 family protein n=1 Tax=Solirubrobacter soli TaxID=363832 RepID=UPI00055F6BC6|nr:VTT domain-containing protein [Solirubrobacter soli]
MLADPTRRRALVRVGAAVLALAVLVTALAVTVGVPTPAEIAAWARAAGPSAPVLFLLFGAVSTCVLFPGNVVATAAGVVFGVFGGIALTLAAATLGATLAFLLARGAGAAPVGRLLGPRATYWRGWIAERGFSAVLTARLLPGTPAGVLNYAAGLTAMPVRAFAAAVAIGALPKTVAYVALGGALSAPLSTRGLLAIGLYAATALAGALLARRQLRAARLTPRG